MIGLMKRHWSAVILVLGALAFASAAEPLRSLIARSRSPMGPSLAGPSWATGDWTAPVDYSAGDCYVYWEVLEAPPGARTSTEVGLDFPR